MSLNITLPVRGFSTRQLLSGNGVPSDTNDGRNGDLYFDLDTGLVYGPKANGAWPEATSSFAGPPGWTPDLAVVADGERRVFQIADYQGGVGEKPDVGGYIGAAGIVTNIAEAVDVRGPSDAETPNVVLQRHVAESAWTTRNTSTVNDTWRSVIHVPELGRAIAVGKAATRDTAIYSDDLITWANGSTPAVGDWLDVTYIPGQERLVAVPEAGDNVMVSDDRGETWSTRPALGAGVSWRAVEFLRDRQRLVAIADGAAMYSDDYGETWLEANPPSRFYRGLAYIEARGRLVAVAGSGAGFRVVTSDDGGETWVERATPADNFWQDVIAIPGTNRLVAVANSGTGNRVMVSDDDGETWATRSNPVDNAWVALAYADALGLLIAVANTGSGNRIMTSADFGDTWTVRTSPADNGWSDVAWAPDHGAFVAVGSSGINNRVMTSASAFSYVYLT